PVFAGVAVVEAGRDFRPGGVEAGAPLDVGRITPPAGRRGTGRRRVGPRGRAALVPDMAVAGGGGVVRPLDVRRAVGLIVGRVRPAPRPLRRTAVSVGAGPAARHEPG